MTCLPLRRAPARCPPVPAAARAAGVDRHALHRRLDGATPRAGSARCTSIARSGSLKSPIAAVKRSAASTVERLDDELGNQRGLLVGRKVARPRDGNHTYPRARFERAPLVVGDTAVAALPVYHPRRHPGLAQPWRDRAVAVQVLQI